jgi:hypothetical protein
VIPSLVNGVNEVYFVNTGGHSCPPPTNSSDQPGCIIPKPRKRTRVF